MANMGLGQTWLQSCGSFKFSLPSAPGTLAQEHLAQFKLAPWSHHPSPPTLVLHTPDRRTKIRAPCFFLQWKATKGQASWISTSSGVYPTFSLQTKDRFVRPHQLPPSACWILPQGASWGKLPDLLETGWTHTTRPLTREGMETISHSWLNSNHIHWHTCGAKWTACTWQPCFGWILEKWKPAQEASDFDCTTWHQIWTPLISIDTLEESKYTSTMATWFITILIQEESNFPLPCLMFDY